MDDLAPIPRFVRHLMLAMRFFAVLFAIAGAVSALGDQWTMVVFDIAAAAGLILYGRALPGIYRVGYYHGVSVTDLASATPDLLRKVDRVARTLTALVAEQDQLRAVVADCPRCSQRMALTPESLGEDETDA
jgi:hypothetical protein